MNVRFWGVRGSVPVAGEQYVRTGGNTSCVEVSAEGYSLVLDGGTGLRALGEHLGPAPVELTILFSHYHWDHIQGVPFFAPAFHPDSDVTFAGIRTSEHGVKSLLARQMQPPTFPVPLDTLKGAKRYLDFEIGSTFRIGPFELRAASQTHPNGVAAYRIEHEGRVVIYATDTEHGLGAAIDSRLIELAEGAHVLIHDAQYHREEYAGERGPSRRGWGHSTWEEAVDAALLAGVERLALYHHDPSRDDDGVDAIESEARKRVPGAFAAREGLVVTV